MRKYLKTEQVTGAALYFSEGEDWQVEHNHQPAIMQSILITLCEI